MIAAPEWRGSFFSKKTARPPSCSAVKSLNSEHTRITADPRAELTPLR